MTGFRLLLLAMFAVLSAYTAIVINSYGFSLFAVFFGDMAKLAWAGQFNLDFMFMLALSGLWVSWRHRFSPAGLGLGMLAFFGGSVFLAVYLLILSFQTRGDVKGMLLGPRATDA